MARLLYNHPADNILTAATLSLSGLTENTLYPLSNALLLNPSLPFKANETGGGGRIILDFGSATTVALVPLIHSNLDPGLSVKWEANATNAWGAPSFSQAFTIAALDGERYRPNVFLNMSAAPPTFRYHSLLIAGTNSQPVIPGLCWVGAVVRELVHNYKWGFKRDDVCDGRKQFFTEYGVDWTYPYLTRRRGLTGGVDTTDAGMLALYAWQQACGGKNQPTLYIPGAPDITDAVLGKWTVDWGYEGEFRDVNVLPVGWMELSRGVAWP